MSLTFAISFMEYPEYIGHFLLELFKFSNVRGKEYPEYISHFLLEKVKKMTNIFRALLLKGQIISEKKIVVPKNFPKKQRNIAKIFGLASKMGQIKKIKALNYIKWYMITNLYDNVPLLF